MTRNEFLVQYDVKPTKKAPWHRVAQRTWPKGSDDAVVAMLNAGVNVNAAQDEAWAAEARKIAQSHEVETFLDSVEVFQCAGHVAVVALHVRGPKVEAVREFANRYGLETETHEKGWQHPEATLIALYRVIEE